MAVSLSKGGNVSLSKAAPGLKRIIVGLGWDTRASDGTDFDLDATAFVCNATGKVRTDSDFIFYNNLKTPEGSVEHTGDNRTGAGDGDDEAIKMDLEKIPADVQKVVFCVTIHEATARKQNFGMVNNAFVRVVNQEGGAELARYDLSEEASIETAMIFAEVYLNSGEWKFKAIGQGFKDGLGPLARSMGVNI